MKESSRRNVSASVRARLLNLSKSTGREFQALALRYAVERFLARLTISPHRDRFILKGAMLYVTWKLDEKRNTMDLDLLGMGNSDPIDLAEAIRGVCAIDIEDDGLTFDSQSIVASAIREDAVYDGARVVMQVRLGTMPIRFQIDVGFGDAVVPDPQLTEFPALLADRGPMIMAYSPESVIAEKFQAMIQLGMANSRMKDYFDIWMLSRTFPLKYHSLRKAMECTFTRRQTPLPDGEPIGLSAEFARNESKQRQWVGFVKRQRREVPPPDLPDVVETIRNFLMPVAAPGSARAVDYLRWNPGEGWRD